MAAGIDTGHSALLDDTSTWKISSNPSDPKIQATIQTDLWNFTTETTFSSNLTVIENSLLVLLCTAFYPVRWFEAKTNMQINQTWNDHNVWKDNALFTSFLNEETLNTNYSMNANYEYESVAKLKVTADIEGEYYCLGPNNPMDPTNEFVVNRIQLIAKPILYDIPDFAEILQTGFDTIWSSPKLINSDWLKENVTLIYTLPIDLNISQTIVRPDGTEIRLLSIDANLVFEYYAPDKTINLYTKIISRNIGQTTIEFIFGLQFLSGEYCFNIESQMKNGSIFKRSKTFVIQWKAYVGVLENIEKPDTAVGYVLVPSGILIELQLRVQGKNTNTTASLLGGKERLPTDRECVVKSQLPTEGADACGVLGVGQTSSEFEVLIRILLNATRPCLLYSVLPVQAETNKFYISSLIVSVANDTFDAQGNPKVITSPVGIQSGTPVYTNESITLRCIMPACMVARISWCSMPYKVIETWSQKCYFYDVNGTLYLENLANDPAIKFSSYYIGSYRMAYDIKFDPLRKNHTNKYTCQTHLGFNIKANTFILLVDDPLGPTFEDGKVYDKEQQTIKVNGKLLLVCDPAGRPQPQILWYWKPANNDQRREPRITDLVGNTTLEVYQSGSYSCSATNKYGDNGRTFVVDYELSYLPLAIGIPIAVVVLSTTLILLWWLKRRANKISFKALAQEFRNPVMVPLDIRVPLNNQADAVTYNRKYEIDRKLFTMTSLLGQGAFGNIFKGEFKFKENGNTILVAVKIPLHQSDVKMYEALLDELKIISNIRPHVNVLQLIGACTNNLEHKQLFVLTEFCEIGSLRDHLRNNQITLKGLQVNEAGYFLGAPGAVEKLLTYCYQVASGMKHLDAENIIHRDLALRNLLLTYNEIVKVSDFGMSRRHPTSYKKKLSPDLELPMRWMAIESLAVDGVYTVKSDVWSFGVVLWEIFSCGETPYPNIDDDFLLRGWLRYDENNRMGPTKIACDPMYKLMRDCWKGNPLDRPTFNECEGIISRILEQKSPVAYQAMLLNLSDAWLNMANRESTKIESSTASGSSHNLTIDNAAVVPFTNEGEDTDELIQSMELPVEENIFGDNIQMQIIENNLPPQNIRNAINPEAGPYSSARPNIVRQ